jgi:hypothetical protein
VCNCRDTELAELTSALLSERAAAAQPQDSDAWRREAAKWQQRIAALSLQLSTEQEDAAAVQSELTARALRAEAAAAALQQEATLWEARGRQLLLCEAELAKVCVLSILFVLSVAVVVIRTVRSWPVKSDAPLPCDLLVHSSCCCMEVHQRKAYTVHRVAQLLNKCGHTAILTLCATNMC